MNRKLVVLASLLLLAGCGADEQAPAEQPKGSAAEEQNDNKQHETEKEASSNTEQAETEAAAGLEGEAKEEAGQAVPQYRMKDDFSIQNIENPDEKVVLLTIDDAPDKYALEMANTLKDLNVKAIFFVNGHFIDTPEEGEVLKQIHQMGFSIGNHTYNHKTLKELTEEQQRKEIIDLNDRIEELTGERPQFFRAPFGMNTDYSKKLAAEEKMLLMNWTYGYDWEKNYQSKDALADIMVNTPLLRNGANLLMHDREWTSAALRDIVIGLEEKGYMIADPALIETPANQKTAAQ
ncbi:polysaccharide deacetylase family protein [Mesobacillus subterraneus]|uniref:Polysaccharide deacetylase family protein n=1 Tax=Mesobacillus subterraneus TaxID=285983 RepID=A0A3R9E872_9BACI|nr:polysaccharide deacetylase family protein [Mesobacillus subterraneus]RSD28175.1 polysaccharide deacetylase family protein [Mesobacillus subterraneus]